MKKFALILILVILISLTVVGPAFAGGGDNLCGEQRHSGYALGVYGRGNGVGTPMYLVYSMGRTQACYATPPKTPWWAGK